MLDTRKIVPLLLAIGVIGVVIYTFVLILRAGKEEVYFEVIPSYAKIEVDGKQVGNGSQYLTPGKHNVTVSAKDFKENKQEINVVEGEVTKVFAALSGANEKGTKWIQDHQALYQALEGKSGQAIAERGEKKLKAFPIIDLLPYNEDGYVIGYKAPSENELIITVHAASSLNRQLALSKIRSWGYEPADYEIDFVDYRSPFTGEADNVHER